MLDRIPTEADWDIWKDFIGCPTFEKDMWDIDIEYAKKHFMGKSKEECFAFFSEDFMRCSDDFTVMPRACFQYYIFALAEYLKNIADVPQKSREELFYLNSSDASSCFLSFITYRLKEDPQTMFPIFAELLPYVEVVAMNQEKLDASLDIYGDFKERLEEIKNLAIEQKIKF